MEDYETKRMGASIDAWKTRFPLLYQGGQYEVNDIANNQKGILSPVVSGALQSAGLEQPKGTDQYSLSTDIGLSPITLAQRTSQAVNRQIALNPEWTNQISGGTLATMVANNYQNQNAFTQFLGANQTANYVSGQTQSNYNTQALLSGVLGAARLGTQAYEQSNPLSYGTYLQGAQPAQPTYQPSYQPSYQQPFYGPTTPPGYTGGSVYSYNSQPTYVSTDPMYNPYGQ
jgi:hypothetical protein